VPVKQSENVRILYLTKFHASQYNAATGGLNRVSKLLIVPAFLLGAASAVACTATSSCTTCQNAIISCSTPAGSTGQCQDTNCSDCGYCNFTVAGDGGVHNIHVPIGCPGLHCTRVRPPRSVGPVVASAGGFAILPGTIDDQYLAGITADGIALSLTADGKGWQGGQFTIANHSKSALVAFKVTFTVYADSGDHLQFGVVTDDYLSQAPLQPGDSRRLVAYTEGAFGARIQSASAEITYVEYADGTRTGSDAVKLGAKLTKERREAIAYAQGLRAQLNAGGDDAAVRSAFSRSTGQEPNGVSDAKGLILATINEKGPGAFAAEVQRIASITPP